MLINPISLLLLLPSTITALPSLHSNARSSSPFTNATWPLPHNITGDDQAGQDTPTEGWGGIHTHDPSVVLGPDGHYYSFSTHGLVAISRASEKGCLDGYWEVLGSVLVNESKIVNAGRADPWAPDVHHANGKYHCYYAVSQFGSQISAIGLATSTSLRPGTWTDHGAVISSSPTASWPLNITNAIDPNLFVDPATGDAYLTYGSFWDDLFQFRLKSGLKQVEYKPVAPTHLSLDPVSPQAEEGSYLSFAGGWYYLWFSHGICCGFDVDALPAPGLEYSIRVGRSKSPQGPFLDMNGVDLTNGGGYLVYGSHDYVYAPGGQGVLSGYEGRDVLYYHYINTNYDPSYADDLKLLGWSYIEYVDGWPVLVYE